MSNPLIVIKILNKYNTPKKFTKLRRFLDIRNIKYEVVKYEDSKKTKDKDVWKRTINKEK